MNPFFFISMVILQGQLEGFCNKDSKIQRLLIEMALGKGEWWSKNKSSHHLNATKLPLNADCLLF